MKHSFNKPDLFPINTSVFFDDIEKEIITTIKNAEICVYLCMAWFSDKIYGEVFRELSKKDITINIILDDNNSNKINAIQESIDYPNIKVLNIKNSNYIMHNKFCVIDYKTVITGSYNYSKNARNHMENILITENNFDLAISFIEEFHFIKYFYSHDGKPVKKDKHKCVTTRKKKIYKELKCNANSKQEIKQLNLKLKDELEMLCHEGTTFNLAVVGPTQNEKSEYHHSDVQVFNLCNNCFYSTKLLNSPITYSLLHENFLNPYDEDNYYEPDNEIEKHLYNIRSEVINRIFKIKNHRLLTNLLSEEHGIPIHAIAKSIPFHEKKYGYIEPERLEITFIRKGHKDYIPDEFDIYEGDIEDIIYSVIYD